MTSQIELKSTQPIIQCYPNELYKKDVYSGELIKDNVFILK